MAQSWRVLWQEGMLLSPQHFQQSGRHVDAVLDARLRAIEPASWGFVELGIDTEAMAAGSFSLTRAVAVFPDGFYLNAPEVDPLPPARPIGPAFPTGQETLDAFLALPLARPGARSAAAPGEDQSSPARFEARYVRVRDENTGENEREIGALVARSRLVFGSESRDEHTWLKVAEITRSATGAFAAREEFIPPVLWISASPAIQRILKKITEMISAKSTELAEQRRQRAQGLVEFTSSEAANFWFLHTVNSSLPILSHYCQEPRQHPRHVFLTLSRLAGELVTFAPDGHPSELPPYQHNELTVCFRKLQERLSALMETIIPTRCIPIPLERHRESVFSGRIADDRLLDGARFYFAVRAEVPEEKIHREVPVKVKISSSDRLDNLIRQALRGVGVRYLPTPPAEIPVQPGRSYFEIDKRGEHWDAIRQSRGIAIYLPPEFTAVKIELMAVKE